jgi:hypothetical protein
MEARAVVSSATKRIARKTQDGDANPPHLSRYWNLQHCKNGDARVKK